MNAKNKIKRGQIRIVDFGKRIGSEQGGIRPSVIIQNDLGNHFSTTTIAVPISSKPDGRILPTHVVIRRENLVYGQIEGKAMLEQISVVDESRIKQTVGKIDDNLFEVIYDAMLVATGFKKHRAPKGVLIK